MRRNPARSARRWNPAYDEGDYRRALAGSKNLGEAELEGAILRGANLAGANLMAAYLRGADLEGANLAGVYLEGASLEGANLEGANLEGANLRGANLTGATLVGANGYGSNLRGANLEGADLKGSDFSGAYLVGTNFTGANLEGVSIEEAVWNEHTVWPNGFSPPRSVAEHLTFSDPTGSEAFRRWFGDSVVKDETGRPVVVYHGTRKGGFTVFDPAKADKHHPGFYFTNDILNANTYVGKRRGDLLLDPALVGDAEGAYRLYIKMERPFVHDAKEGQWDALRVPAFRGKTKTFEVAQAVKDTGIYDGVIFKNLRDAGGQSDYDAPSDVYVVFDPRNIKSATANVGTYDPNDPDIRRNPLARITPNLGGGKYLQGDYMGYKTYMFILFDLDTFPAPESVLGFYKHNLSAAAPGYGQLTYELAARALGYTLEPGDQLSEEAEVLWERIGGKAKRVRAKNDAHFVKKYGGTATEVLDRAPTLSREQGREIEKMVERVVANIHAGSRDWLPSAEKFRKARR